MKGLTIGKVAQKTGVSVETIRFYERKSLLDEPPRNESGYRQYPPDTVVRLQFIQRAKELGFSLKEIRELFSLRYDQHATCQDVRKQANAKLLDIEEKINDLIRIKKALAKLACQCSGVGPVNTCPILAAMEPSKENT